jgi:hypothetical protein
MTGMASSVRVKNISKSQTLGFGPNVATIAPGATAVIDLDTGANNSGDGGVVRRAFEQYIANGQLVVVAET